MVSAGGIWADGWRNCGHKQVGLGDPARVGSWTEAVGVKGALRRETALVLGSGAVSVLWDSTHHPSVLVGTCRPEGCSPW